MPVKAYTINLDMLDREQLERLAKERDATISALVRRAVREFLDREYAKNQRGKRAKKGGLIGGT